MSSPMTQGGAPYTYTFPMYATFPSHPNVAMALAGYRFSTLNTIDFQTFFDDIGAVNFIISIHPWQDMQIYRLGFFILMVNPSSDWVWMLNGSKNNLIKQLQHLHSTTIIQEGWHKYSMRMMLQLALLIFLKCCIM